MYIRKYIIITCLSLLLAVGILLIPNIYAGTTDKPQFRITNPVNNEVFDYSTAKRKWINTSDVVLDSVDVRILTGDTVLVYDILGIYDTNTSHYLQLKWNENDTASRILSFLVAGGDRSMTLYENFAVGNGYDVTITAEDVAGSIVLDKQTFEVEGEGTATRLFKLVAGADAPTIITISGTTFSLTGGANTFNIDAGTSSLDVATAKTVDFDMDFKVDGTGTTITGVTQTNIVTLNESFNIGDGHTGTLTYSAGSKVLTVEDNVLVGLDINALEGLSGTGLVTRTASAAYTERTITGDTNEITVTNGNGVSGNPSLSIDLNKDLVTTAPITGGTDNILVGANSDITIAIPVATTSADGYLSQTDWDTFNAKLDNIVEDITPQLGGDLDANGFNIAIDPADTLFLSTDTYIVESSNGVFELYVDDVKIVEIIEAANDTVKITAQLNMNGAITGMQKFEIEEDAGLVTWWNLPVSATPADGTVEGGTMNVDNNVVLTVQALADHSGGVDEHQAIIQGHNYNTAHSQLILKNTDEQATGETGQTVDLEFKVKGTIDSGSNFTDEEAGKISVYKTADYWHASDQTDNDAGFKLYTVTNGAYVLNTTFSEDDFATVGNISSATYGSDKSVSDAELLYLDATSSIQTQLDARCLESVFGTSIGTGLVLDATVLKASTGLQSLSGLTLTAGDMAIATGANAWNVLDAGANTTILVGGGAANPVWTTATGTGAPVRATSPTFITSIVMGSADLNEAELEILDGSTVTTTEFEQLATVGATTISANQWALLGGLAETLTNTEINILDGVTDVSAENLSYISDLSGNIQNQLEYKAMSSNPTFYGFIKRSVTAGITAVNPGGQGDGALTTDINEISACGAGSDAVTLPTAVAGLEIFIINNGAQILEIWPASGDDLGAGVNTATTLAAGSNVTFISYNAVNWEIK